MRLPRTGHLRRLLLAAIALLGLGAAAAPVPAGPAKIVLPSGEFPLRVVERGPLVFVAVPDLIPLLRGSLVADEPGAIYTWTLGERVLHFTVEAAVVTLDDAVEPLPAAPFVEEGVPYLPLDFVLRSLAEPAGWSGEWSKGERLLRIRAGSVGDIALEVSVAHAGDASKAVFTFSAPVRFQAEKRGDQVTLVFSANRLALPFADREFDDPIVSKVSLRGRGATILFRRGTWASEVYSLANPSRVVVEIQPVAREIGGIRLGKKSEPADAPTAVAPEGIRTIVLDPGHGGGDVGAKGPTGALEKDLTLELAKALESVLVAKGYRVLLTRDRDVQVALEDRPAFANHHKADLFLSIHLNASATRKARGPETYYLSLAATDEAARRLAEAENASGGGEAPARPASSEDLDFLLWDLVQNEHVKQSARLADEIQEQLDALSGLENRGIKQAPFRVLVGAAMPAVLVEAAFLSNAEEEKELSDAAYRKRIAESIAAGIEDWRATVDPRFAAERETAASPPAATPPAVP